MRTLAPLLAAVALSGCASVRPVPPAPPDVVQIQPDRVARCRSLGAVQGAHANGASVSENEDAAIEDVRGQASRMGGNAFVITHRTSGVWRSVVQADAYLCPSWEPVPGLAPQERPAAR